MNKDMIIIYGSCYGTTKQYADELSGRIGCEAVSFENVRDINAYQTIIYMGGLYAGGVQGMKKTLKKLSEISAMIETYNKQVDFVDFDSLDPIVRSL
jgi:hypothetical protein